MEFRDDYDLFRLRAHVTGLAPRRIDFAPRPNLTPLQRQLTYEEWLYLMSCRTLFTIAQDETARRNRRVIALSLLRTFVHDQIFFQALSEHLNRDLGTLLTEIASILSTPAADITILVLYFTTFETLRTLFAYCTSHLLYFPTFHSAPHRASLPLHGSPIRFPPRLPLRRFFEFPVIFDS